MKFNKYFIMKLNWKTRFIDIKLISYIKLLKRIPQYSIIKIIQAEHWKDFYFDIKIYKDIYILKYA